MSTSTHNEPRRDRAHRVGRRGLTALELLVVCSILMTLAGILLPAIQKVRERAHRIACMHNLKQIGLAMQNYHNTFRTLPPYMSGKGRDLYGSWFVHLMPYMGYQGLYNVIANHPRNNNKRGAAELLTPGIWQAEIKHARFPELTCREDATQSGAYGTTNYLANWYALTPDNAKGVYHAGQSFRDLRDGVGNVVLFAEAYSECNGLVRLAVQSAGSHNFGVTGHGKPSDDPSYAPTDYTMFQVQPDKCEGWRTQTPHTAMPVGMADASVRLLERDFNPTTWKQLLKPRDGAYVNLD